MYPSPEQITTLDQKIKDLEEKIADLKGRFPAHSLKPAMFAQLEEFEEELARLRSIKTQTVSISGN